MCHDDRSLAEQSLGTWVLIKEAVRAVRSRQTINPRTVLGFYATVLGLLLAAVVSAVGVLAATDTSTNLIPWLLGFAGSVVFLLLVGVFIVTLVDPSHLMLGQITGSEYVEIRRATLGDSTRGEHVVTIVGEDLLTSIPDFIDETQALPASAGDEKQEESA
jgi:hypothetical protein